MMMMMMMMIMMQPNTLLFQSCGSADSIATCYGGRNRLCAEEYCRHRLRSDYLVAGAHMQWERIEQDLLNGQKLQGVGTCEEVMKYLAAVNGQREFPLFTRIHAIALEGAHPSTLFDWDIWEKDDSMQ
jgi:glycerol-3-phosphate dehydrogenase (NAD+)